MSGDTRWCWARDCRSAHILGSEFEPGKKPCQRAGRGCVPGGQGWFLSHTPFPGLFFLPFSYLHLSELWTFLFGFKGPKNNFINM